MAHTIDDTLGLRPQGAGQQRRVLANPVLVPVARWVGSIAHGKPWQGWGKENGGRSRQQNAVRRPSHILWVHATHG